MNLSLVLPFDFVSPGINLCSPGGGANGRVIRVVTSFFGRKLRRDMAHNFMADFVQLLATFPPPPFDLVGTELLPDADGHSGTFPFLKRGKNIIQAVDADRDQGRAGQGGQEGSAGAGQLCQGVVPARSGGDGRRSE